MLRYLPYLLATYLSAQPATTVLLGSPGLENGGLGSGRRGDGGPATSAILDSPWGLAVDHEGRTYVSEANAGLIRRILPTGEIETYAGTGTRADGRDGASPRETHLLSPTALLIDAEGNLVFFDAGACRLRRIDPEGLVQTIGGTGRCAGSTTGGLGGFPGGGFVRERPALETDLGPIGGMVLDPTGRLVFSDEQAHVVRRLDSDGFIRTIAGSHSAGFYGDTLSATSAQLNTPGGVAYDAEGNLYIADGRNCRLRRVNSEGIINTVAGRAVCATRASSFVNGAGTSTALGRLQGLAYRAETNVLLIASAGQARVIQFDLNLLRLTSYAGNGTLGRVDSTIATRVNEPRSIAFHPTLGTLITAQTAFQVLRVSDNQVQVLAGRWPQLDVPIPVQDAALLQPSGFCSAPDGSTLIVDAGSEQVLRFRPDELSPVVGALYPTGFTSGDNGEALQASINAPRRIACATNGDLYLSHGSQVRRITADGIISTIAKSYVEPTGLAIDSEGRLLIADAASHQLIRYHPAARTFTTIAGTGKAGFSGDDGPAIDAQLNSPGDLVLDPQGNIYLADRGNRRVRLISPDGQIRTIAGSQREFTYGDITGEPATDIGLGRIAGLALDANSYLFILETERLSSLSPDGQVNVLLGYLSEDDDGVVTYRGQSIPGASGLLASPTGHLFLALQQDPRILSLSLSPE